MNFQEAWDYTQTIEGWFSEEEGRLLFETARIAARNYPEPFLEIGSYYGRSTSLLARHRETTLIDGLDTDDPALMVAVLDRHLKMCENLAGLPVSVIPMPSQFVSAFIRNGTMSLGPYSLIFIDGCHNSPAIDHDCREFLPLVREYGYAAFHDYDSNFPDVTRVVTEATKDWEQVGKAGTLLVVRRTK